MGKSVRLSDIAREMNVSTVTVSNALSGQKGVSDDLRERIIAKANELGYRSSSSSAASEASKSIGVIISDVYLDKYATFYWKFYQEVAIVGTEKNCFAMVEVIKMQDEKAKTLPKIVQEGKVDGLIVLGEMSKEYLKMLQEYVKIPLVFLDFYDKSISVDAVISNNFYGMYELTNYLIDMGHKDLCYLGTIQANSSIMDRFFGFAKSLTEHGIPVTSDIVIDDRNLTDYEIEVKLPDRIPTAFVCNCDLTASRLIDALNQAGYRVPEDISIVGFDNYLFPGLCDVEITTYDVHMREMAETAFHHILQSLDKDIPKGEAKLYITNGNMVIKDSVRRLDSENQ